MNKLEMQISEKEIKMFPAVHLLLATNIFMVMEGPIL